MTILYVDDDSDDRELLAEALVKIDPSIACRCVCDGRQAIDILKSIDPLPDLILLDVNMPVMDGKECLIEMKKDWRLRGVPIVMYSTTNDAEEISFFYQSGAAFMRKPDTFQELCNALVKVLRHYHA